MAQITTVCPWRAGSVSARSLHMTPISRVCPWIMLVVFGSLLTGCGKSALKEDSPEGQHLRKVADFCQEYAALKKKPLTQLNEVKQWAIKEKNATEDDFLSTRDKEPYGVVL